MPAIRCGSRTQVGLNTARVKLLFDQNLAPLLVDEFKHLFPESQHVRAVGLSRVDDIAVWEYAKQYGFTLVSKDADFHQMSLVHGGPPRVVWVRLGTAPPVTWYASSSTTIGGSLSLMPTRRLPSSRCAEGPHLISESTVTVARVVRWANVLSRRYYQGRGCR